MPDSSLFIAHIIFSTKGWQPIITSFLMEEIIDRLKRNFESKDSQLLLAMGREEHIHILGRFTEDIPFSRIIGWSKGECSHWINEKYPDLHFYWQKGFWYEMVEENELNDVADYINNQETIHQDITFQEEITRFRKELE